MELVNCTPEYWDFVRNLRNDERNQEGFFTHSSITEEQQEKFMKKNSGNYMVCLLDKTPVGYVGVLGGDEITYCTHPDYKKRGVGTFMVEEFSKKFPRMTAEVKPENLSSRRVFQKLGWKEKIIYIKNDTI